MTRLLSACLLALLLHAAPAAAQDGPSREEVVAEVSRVTGLASDVVSAALERNPAWLDQLGSAVSTVAVIDKLLSAKEAEVLVDYASDKAVEHAMRLLPGPFSAFIEAVKLYKDALEFIRDHTFVPALEARLASRYAAARGGRRDYSYASPQEAFDEATTASFSGYWPQYDKQYQRLLRARGYNADLVGKQIEAHLKRQLDDFWIKRLEAGYLKGLLAAERDSLADQVWDTVSGILDRLAAPPIGLNAGLFPDPETDLPEGWWWARSAGAVYEPPHAYEPSHTPMWMQTVELSSADGYVFRQYGNRADGSGSWCRPQGKCDLPYQRVEIGILDWSMHGDRDSCAASIQGSVEAFPDQYERLSKYAVRLTGTQPDQYLIKFCLKSFMVSIGITAMHTAPQYAVALHFSKLISGKIEAQTAQ